MVKKFGILLTLILLTGCMKPLPPEAFTPANPEFYVDFPDSSFLREKVGLGTVINSLHKDDVITGENYGAALANSLRSAKLLATENPAYTLNANIVDYRWPDSGFTYITGGAAVQYSLVENKSGYEVYANTITSTYEMKKGFLEDASYKLVPTLAIALGENSAQITRELAYLKKTELKPTATAKE